MGYLFKICVKEYLVKLLKGADYDKSYLSSLSQRIPRKLIKPSAIQALAFSALEKLIKGISATETETLETLLALLASVKDDNLLSYNSTFKTFKKKNSIDILAQEVKAIYQTRAGANITFHDI